MSHLDDELAQDYLADCQEHLAAMETEILAIKMSGAAFEDERLDRIFRAAHAICSPAAFFGLGKVRELAYQAENLVALIRSHHAAPTGEQSAALLGCTDKLGEMFENPGASEEVDIREVSAEMGRLLAGQPTRSQAKAASPTPLAGSGVQIHLDADPEVPQPAQGKLKILLAEDDFACRLLLQTFLARYGECHIAVNGREAVNAFAAALQSGQPYDLICMDIMMPEMDGREAVRQVRALEEAQGIHSTFGARIFMTTTVQEIKEVFHCFKELCDAYLMKPIDLGELLKQMKFFRLLP